MLTTFAYTLEVNGISGPNLNKDSILFPQNVICTFEPTSERWSDSIQIRVDSSK